MQNNENRGSLSDKFQNFGAKPSDGLWNAISEGLDTGKPVQSKRSKSLWKSLFWAFAGFFIASTLAISIWMVSSNETITTGNSVTASKSSSNSKQKNKNTTSQTNGIITASSTIKNPDSSISTTPEKDKTTSISTTQQKVNSPRNTSTLAIRSTMKSANNTNNANKKNVTSKVNQQKQRVKIESFGRTTEKQASNLDLSNKIQKSDQSSTSAIDSQMNNESDHQNNLATNSTLSSVNNPQSLNTTGNDSISSSDLVVVNNSPTNDSITKDSSVTTNTVFIPPTPAPKPAKWMIGGHIGAMHGNVYLLNFDQDQYTNPDMLTNSTLKYLPAHLYWSADIEVSRKIGKRIWLESGLQAGMQHVKQNPTTTTNTTSMAYSTLQPVEGRAYNLGIPLAFRFDFKPTGKIQFYERIGTLHTFPYAVNARYISSNSSQPEKWMHYQYWTYTLSAYFNFGMEYPISKNLYWDIRTEIRFMKEMVSTHRNYDNTLWYGGSTGLVWKF